MTDDDPQAIPAKWLAVLRCPHTNDALLCVNATLLSRLNLAIRHQHVHDQLRQRLDRPLDAALINERATLIYPVRNGVPILLSDEAIDVVAAWLADDDDAPDDPASSTCD